MSMQFNDTTNQKGIVQTYERFLNLTPGDVSGNTTKLAQFTAEVNVAMDDFTRIAIESSGTWQFDDTNQTDYPIIKTNIVSGQRDYTFSTDQDGNLILDIYKVMVLPSATATQFYELNPIDQQTDYSTIDTEITNTGLPWQYDKTANGIFLDPIPGYNATNGLKVYINREASYFTAADTSKKPGVPGIFHRYFALLPAYRYAASKSMPQAGGRLRNGAFTGLLMEVNDMEAAIKKYFGARSRDERKQLSMAPIRFR